MQEQTNIALFWKEYQEDRLLQKSDYHLFNKKVITDSDLKEIAELKSRKGDNLIQTYGPGYLISNLGPEAFALLEKIFKRFEKQKEERQKNTSQLSVHERTTFKFTDIKLEDFMWAFMQVLEHNIPEELFISNALKELYIATRDHLKDRKITWKEVTDVLIEQMNEAEALTASQLGSTKMTVKAEKKIRHPRALEQENMIKKLNLDLPDLVGEEQSKLSFFVRAKNIDKKAHKAGVNQVLFFKPLDKLLCLDNQANYILAYEPDLSKVEKLVKPKDHLIDSTILDFAVNNKEARIGACLRDYTLAFWELEDGFEFEKVIKSKLTNLQIKIWPLEQASRWITTDKDNNLYVWNIETEKPKQLEKLHNEKVMEVVEIAKIQAFICSSLDKKLIVWDSKTLECRFPIEIKNSFSVHTIKYSTQHDLMFTASYENRIKVWHFDSAIECTEITQLQGHDSMITALELIQDTNYLISSDDFGCVKCWNLRDQLCQQTYRFNLDIYIGKLVCTSSLGFVTVSNRIYLFNLTQLDMDNMGSVQGQQLSTFKETNSKIGNEAKKEQESNQFCSVTDIMYSSVHDHVIVGTKQDIRLIDCITGKQDKILVNLTKGDEELTFISLDKAQKKFLVADYNGNIQTSNYNTALQTDQFIPHKKECFHVHLDSKNSLLTSCGLDNQVIIQHYNPNSSQKGKVLRTLKNPNGTTDILFCAVSPYLNLIATANDRLVTLWNYENIKIAGVCYVDQQDIRQLKFIDELGFLVVLDEGNKAIHFYQIKPFQTVIQYYKPIWSFVLENKERVYDYPKCCDFILGGTEQEQSNILKWSKQEFIVALGGRAGYIYLLDLQQLLKESNIERFRDQRYRDGANASRNDSFNGISYFNSEFPLESEAFKILKLKEKFMEAQPIQEVLRFANQLHFRESITAIRLCLLQESQSIISASNDGFIKITTCTQGDLICSLNIFNPLPIKWTLPYTKQRKRQITLKRALLDLIEMNRKYRKTSFTYQPSSTIVGKKNMFLTEAFNINVLKDKYKGVEEVMRKATDQYTKILHSEVSTKVSLRQLQLRQNRKGMEQDVLSERSEHKEEEKKSIDRRKSLIKVKTLKPAQSQAQLLSKKISIKKESQHSRISTNSVLKKETTSFASKFNTTGANSKFRTSTIQFKQTKPLREDLKSNSALTNQSDQSIEKEDKFKSIRHQLSNFALRLADHQELLPEIQDLAEASFEQRSARLEANLEERHDKLCQHTKELQQALNLTKQITEMKKIGLPTNGMENELKNLVDDEAALRRRIIEANKKNFIEDTETQNSPLAKTVQGSKFRSNKNWLEYAKKFHPELPENKPTASQKFLESSGYLQRQEKHNFKETLQQLSVGIKKAKATGVTFDQFREILEPKSLFENLAERDLDRDLKYLQSLQHKEPVSTTSQGKMRSSQSMQQLQTLKDEPFRNLSGLRQSVVLSPEMKNRLSREANSNSVQKLFIQKQEESDIQIDPQVSAFYLEKQLPKVNQAQMQRNRSLGEFLHGTRRGVPISRMKETRQREEQKSKQNFFETEVKNQIDSIMFPPTLKDMSQDWTQINMYDKIHPFTQKKKDEDTVLLAKKFKTRNKKPFLETQEEVSIEERARQQRMQASKAKKLLLKRQVMNEMIRKAVKDRARAAL